MSWEKIKSEYLIRSKWLNVRKDTVKISDELTVDDYYITENNDVVIIFPVVDKEYVLLKKEYRYPIDKITLELPGGTFDRLKEEALSAAKRELLEETGFSSASWISFGEFYDHPTKDTNKMYLFLAGDCLQTAKPQNNPQEEIELVKVHIGELEDHIKGSVVQVTGSITCIYRAMLHLKSSLPNNFF